MNFSGTWYMTSLMTNIEYLTTGVSSTISYTEMASRPPVGYNINHSSSSTENRYFIRYIVGVPCLFTKLVAGGGWDTRNGAARKKRKNDNNEKGHNDLWGI